MAGVPDLPEERPMSLRRLSDIQPAEGSLTPAGAFNNRISLLAPGARAQDGGAGTPTVFATCWAAVSALGGRELAEAQQISEEITHLVTIPYVAGVTSDMTIQMDARRFVIRYPIDPDERRFELRIYCAERGQNA